MRKSLLAVTLLLLVFHAQIASAAIQYEFRQSTQSDLESMPPTECVGRAVIDGDRSRVEFVSGNAYPAGTYVIATNGSRTMTYVDPSRKSYVEVDAASVAMAIGARKITIGNKKIDMTPMSDHPIIAGIPTDHYRLAMSYDITVNFGTIPLSQTVQTVIDKWTTMAFGDVSETFVSSGSLRTGNADLDDLMTTENTKIKGFALRQIVHVTTINNRAGSVPSELKVNRTITQTRELVVTSIQATPNIGAAAFVVPASFHKADPLHDDSQKAPMQVLSMEPSGQ